MSKKLVAYFSASGVTAKVAETLAEAIGADIFEIEPKVPYTETDLNWMDKKARSTIEMNDPASRPEFATSGGSDIGKTNERLAPSCKGAKLVDGKVFKHNVGHKELAAWVDGLKL